MNNFPDESDHFASDSILDLTTFFLEEKERGKSLKSLGLNTTAREPEFDKLTRMAGKFIRVPYACFQVCLGSDLEMITKSSFLDDAFSQADVHELEKNIPTLKVLANRKSEISTGNPNKQHSENLTIEANGGGAYISLPVRSPSGHVIGVFSVVETQSRVWEKDEIELVERLTHDLVHELEIRHQHLDSEEKFNSTPDQLQKVLSVADCLVWEANVTINEDSDWSWSFNINPSGLFNRLFGEVVPPQNVGLWYRFEIPQQEEMNKLCRDALLNGKKGYQQEFQAITPKETYWIREDVSVKKIADKKFWLVGVATDVTSKKKLEEDLKRSKEEALDASRLKSEFLANMSHEIRTPMNGILGITQLLEAEELNDDQLNLTGLIHECAESLLEIINSILDFSKIEAGKLEIRESPIHVLELGENVLRLLSPTAQNKGITLKQSFDSNLTEVLHGDPVRIRQIMINLLGNAIKFTEEGFVEFSIQKVKNTESAVNVQIEIQDSGIGISESDQALLFQPFQQVDGSHQRNHGGTGLGLAITKQLVDAMGGELAVESVVGKGSTFRVNLVLQVVGPDAPRDEDSSSTGNVDPVSTVENVQNVPRKHILIVDDNELNRMVCRQMLEIFGYSADEVDGGQNAIQMLQKKQFSLVLMDCQMPGLDGYETTRRIRLGEANSSNADIPIIGVTAHAMVGDREKCLDSGMDEYVSKPIRMEIFEEVLNQLV